MPGGGGKVARCEWSKKQDRNINNFKRLSPMDKAQAHQVFTHEHGGPRFSLVERLAASGMGYHLHMPVHAI
jgi:hypothetical protein